MTSKDWQDQMGMMVDRLGERMRALEEDRLEHAHRISKALKDPKTKIKWNAFPVDNPFTITENPFIEETSDEVHVNVQPLKPE